MGQMTQPTVLDLSSFSGRKIGPKDKASIPSGPTHHAHNNTTTTVCSMKQKQTKYTQINTNKSMHSEMGPG